jgi:hypothetical protein
MQLKHVAQFMLERPSKMAKTTWNFSETAAKDLLNRVAGSYQKSIRILENPVQP